MPPSLGLLPQEVAPLRLDQPVPRHEHRLLPFEPPLFEGIRTTSSVGIMVAMELATGIVINDGPSSMELEFGGLLGREVDLRSYGDLSRYFRDRVRAEARDLYAA